MRIGKKFYIAAASLVVAVGAFMALNATGSQAVSSFRNCNDDAIIRCGAVTEAELLQKYDQNVGDVQNIYKHYGITRDLLAGTASGVTIAHGTVYQDGRVVVGGKTVATGAYSVSRVRFTSAGTPRNVVINGKTYYEGPSMAIFTGPVDAFVYMKNGAFYKAVLSSCGNPLVAVPEKKPVFACEKLSYSKLDRTRFEFTASATARDGANIAHYVFDFGDGNTKTQNSNVVEHTYAQPGTYTVTVKVNISIGGERQYVTSEKCKVVIKVEEEPKEPIYKCDSLTAQKLSRDRYRFTAAATAQNGANIAHYLFDFGDGNDRTQNSNVVEHTYAEPGTYTATVRVNISIDGERQYVTSEKCKVTIKVEEEPKVPVYTCDSLTKTQISRTKFSFTTEASAENAQIVSYNYNFGDGNTLNNAAKTVEHTYAEPGTYNVTVTVNFRVNGEIETRGGANCKVTVKVDEEPEVPVYKCESLTARLITTKDRTYVFTLSYVAEGGATLDRVVYNFGDGTSETFTPANATNVEHQFAAPGTYTTTTTLYFDVEEDGEVVEKTDTCTYKIIIPKPENCPIPGKEHLPKDSPECKVDNCPIPGKEHLPKDSPECKEDKEYCPIPGKEDLPKDSPDCVETPPELPPTGLDAFIGGGLGIGSITAAGYYFSASRRNLLDALLKK